MPAAHRRRLQGGELVEVQQKVPMMYLSLSEIRSEHIDGVIRQELASTEFAQRPEQLVVSGHPCSAPDVSERRCNTASLPDPSAACPPYPAYPPPAAPLPPPPWPPASAAMAPGPARTATRS